MANPLSKAKLSAYRKLQSKKIRESEDRFLIEGWHLLEEAMVGGVPLQAVIFDESRELEGNDLRVKNMAIGRAETVFAASESQIRALSDTQTSPGVIAAVGRVRSDLDGVLSALEGKDRSFVVALDGVGDPGNCGSIVRACDWFGADAVLLGMGCSEIENGKFVRATMGALFHLPLAKVESMPNSLKNLQESGYHIVASSLGDSESLSQFNWPSKTVLVIGNEARGVSQRVLSLADTRLQIPKFGRGESLNAAMAASVMLGHWRV
jgi:TrmH family RNA methyltransferase|tara:strand:+ start:195 stop:989 length:795 start_codon:yes stop_codon:yes gene_type:complete